MLGKVNLERSRKDSSAKTEIFSHPIFNAITEILKGLEKLTFEQAKAMIGKSLREDYSLIEQTNNISSEIVEDSLKKEPNLRVEVED